MLDFSRLKTPANHGEILVEPPAARWAEALRGNRAIVGGSTLRLLGVPLAEWRLQARQALHGAADRPLIVTGHQPELFHPGVWAKRVCASRAAAALQGIALNLVVDCDAAKQTSLAVASLTETGLTLRHVRLVNAPAGSAYEHIPRQTPEELARLNEAVSAAMGERLNSSLMPTFFRGVREGGQARDWVDQVIAGCRAVESELDVRTEECRVSETWCNPLLLDVMLNATRFAASYNAALATYRRQQGVRDPRRPIPDLETDGERCEVPLWAIRRGLPRTRVYVERAAGVVRIFAGTRPVAELSERDAASCDGVRQALGTSDGWQLRPRALALTLWARLLLADLFVHGIGGAKYDRISDGIIADYYGLTPPAMACVSATLHVDLAREATPTADLRVLRSRLRDLRHNPQRWVAVDADLAPVLAQRADAVAVSDRLRRDGAANRAARREAFLRIRSANTALLRLRPGAVPAAEAEVRRAALAYEQGTIARNREYFFGLYTRAGLEELLAALPAPACFAV
ncbi:MAG: hypothetical protein HY763_16345 [Planctomycetes bacterium]|nr:hypothetical protein [Planctomycetota bacterium]